MQQFFINEKIKRNAIAKIDLKEFANKAKIDDIPATEGNTLLCTIRKHFLGNIKSESQNINVKVASEAQ